MEQNNTPHPENWRDILARMEAKIDHLEKQVNKINYRVNPPWWKNFAKFVANNFFTILTLISVLLVAWKAWFWYQDLNNQINNLTNLPRSIQNLPQNAGNSLKGILNSIKF